MNKNLLILPLAVLLVISSTLINHHPSLTENDQIIFPPHHHLATFDYVFIWDEYENAPDDQEGDDSVVFGPSFGPFHNYNELVNKLQSLETNFPEIITVFSIGKTYYGRDIYCVRITDESNALSKSEVLIVAQHHAREQITVENALYFVDKIVNDSLDPSSGISQLLSRKEIYVIPSLNIDGAELMSRFSWQRKTARPNDEDSDGVTDEFEIFDVNNDGYVDKLYFNNGTVRFEGIDLDGDGKIGEDAPGGVDPNRNYDYQFGNLSGASLNSRAEDYLGSYPFSENCTARLRDFILQRNFKTALSLHSGTRKIIPPWAWSNKLVEGDDGELHNLTGLTFQNLTGIPMDWLYLASGEWGDWMYGRKKSTTQLVFTIETYGNDSAMHGYYNSSAKVHHLRGIWDMFNPPANQVIENSHDLYGGLLYLVEFEIPSSSTTQSPVPNLESWFFIPAAVILMTTIIQRGKRSG